MAPSEEQPKDFPTGEAALPKEPTWHRYAGQIAVALIILAVGGLMLNWRDDAVRNEILGRVVAQVDKLQTQVQSLRDMQLGDRYTGTQAREDWKFEEARHRELESRFNRLERDLSNLKLQVAKGHPKP